MSDTLVTQITDAAYKAREASTRLVHFSAQQRNQALLAVASHIEANAEAIITANSLDLKEAAQAVNSGTMSPALFNRLKLDQPKLDGLVTGIRQLATLPDPVGALTMARELDEGLTLYKQTCPIGVVLIIFESRPDALPQIVSLLIKSGNAGLIKGGKEARHSIQALFTTIMTALSTAGYPAEAFALLSSREEVNSLMKLDNVIDLVIPRGSNELVRQIQTATRIPVLGHAEGICHIYVDADADQHKALRICSDAKCQYPSACNSAETFLIHKDLAAQFLPKLISCLQELKVEVRCQTADIEALALKGVQTATQLDWSTEYCDLIVSVKVVDSLEEAIAHINKYGSRHTDAIVTERKQAFEQFAAEVDSAGVYWNVSTRFADGFRYGFGAEVGISTSKLHPRGPVGVDGLVTYKYKLIGNGQVVGDYASATGRQFKHRDLPF